MHLLDGLSEFHDNVDWPLAADLEDTAGLGVLAYLAVRRSRQGDEYISGWVTAEVGGGCRIPVVLGIPVRSAGGERTGGGRYRSPKRWGDWDGDGNRSASRYLVDGGGPPGADLSTQVNPLVGRAPVGPDPRGGSWYNPPGHKV